jgi:hypothetical protein
MLKPTLAALLMLTIAQVAQAESWNDPRSRQGSQRQEEPEPRGREQMSSDSQDPRASRAPSESRYGKGFEERRRESRDDPRDERRERN